VTQALAWAAGLFDGEGSVSIYCYPLLPGKQPHCRNIQLQLSNTHEATVRRFAALAGVGNVSVYSRRFRKRPQWRWDTAAANAEHVLCLLLPWLVTKREQAEIALKLREQIRATRHGRGVRLPPEELTARCALRNRLHAANRGEA
jgi:hypothetical protein